MEMQPSGGYGGVEAEDLQEEAMEMDVSVGARASPPYIGGLLLIQVL